MRGARDSCGAIMLFRTASLWLAHDHERARGSRSGAHCRPLSPDVKHVADGTVLEEPRRDFHCRVTTVERSEQLVLDPGDRFRCHVMDGPGQDGAASAIQPSLQFHLQSTGQLFSIELPAE